jgi:hypothetical protein
MFERFLLGTIGTALVAVVLMSVLGIMAERVPAKADDALVINGVELTAVRVDGARCILAQESNRMALACDFTFAKP